MKIHPFGKRPLFTDTVKKIALWEVAIFFLLFVVSNVFTIAITNHILNENIDTRLKSELETLLHSFTVKNDSINIPGYNEISEPHFIEVQPGSFFLQVFDLKGKLLLSSQNIKDFGKIPFNRLKEKAVNTFENLKFKGHVLRILYAPLYSRNNSISAYLQLSVFKTEYSSIMDRIILFNLFNLPFILAIIILVSVFIARKSYAPLNQIIDTAKNITENNLKARIKYKADPQDEIGKLRDTLNELFTRLEIYINQISQFTDNASHQLMTPLTAAKTEIEFILKKERTPEEYKETVKMLSGQVDKMISIVKALLIISKFTGKEGTYKSIFKVSQMIEHIKVMFVNKNIQYKIGENIFIRGNQDAFQIVIENLIDNAVKYSNEDGKIVLTAKKESGQTKISVEDFGIGINEEEQEKIFDRFYRSSAALNLNIKGYGLGLSMVKTVVSSMGGKILVENNQPQGSKFILIFPEVRIE
ncbi:MAG: sensor histidine kinase [Ignavibacteriaceae bacterium]